MPDRRVHGVPRSGIRITAVSVELVGVNARFSATGRRAQPENADSAAANGGIFSVLGFVASPARPVRLALL